MKRNLKSIIAAAMILCGVVASVCLLFSGQSSKTAAAQTGAVVWSGELADAAPEAVGGIKIPGYSNLYFPAGAASVPLTLCNPADNSCLFQFELYLDEETIPIFVSDYIAPGYALEEVTLTRAPAAGTHTMQIKINTKNAESGLAMNGAMISANLTVA